MRHVRLLILDLDYVTYDCAALKARALRHSLISFAEGIPQSVRLPGPADVEEGYREHGFRWIQFLEIGLDEEKLGELQSAYRIHEARLVDSGAGGLYPGLDRLLLDLRREDIVLALGAEASREYLLAVSDRQRLDQYFDMSFCTEEFGVGSADEMIEEIMRYAEVNPSETVLLATRPLFFQAAHNRDVLTIGCGWGIHRQGGLAEADLRTPTLGGLEPALQKADELATQYLL